MYMSILFRLTPSIRDRCVYCTQVDLMNISTIKKVLGLDSCRVS